MFALGFQDEFKVRKSLRIREYNFSININSPPTANAVTSSLNIQRGGAGLLRPLRGLAMTIQKRPSSNREHGVNAEIVTFSALIIHIITAKISIIGADIFTFG